MFIVTNIIQHSTKKEKMQEKEIKVIKNLKENKTVIIHID